MKCRIKDKELALFVSGDLDERRRLRLETHLESCRRCMASLRTLQKQNSALHEMGDAAPPMWMEKELARRLAGIAVPETRRPVPGQGLQKQRVSLSLAAGLLAAVVLGAALLAALGGWGPHHSTVRIQAPSISRLSAAPEGVPLSSAEKVFYQPPQLGPPATVPRRGGRSSAEKQLAAGADQFHRSRNPLIVRLQTSDPHVVIYWQFNPSGG